MRPLCSAIATWLLILQVCLIFRASNADVTFAVDNVTELAPSFLVASVQDAVRYCSKYEVVHEELDMPPDCQLVKEYDDPFHSLVGAVQMAYAGHLPLSLSPDHVWAAVLQGVALHNAQPGAAHQRCYKVDDVSDAGSVNCASWGDVYNGVTTHLLRASPFPDAVPQSFTTTDTKPEKMAGLAGLSRPHEDNTCFSRQMYCGIPRVMLQGKPADWAALAARVEGLLRRCDLQWWLCALRPVLGQFVEASQGRVSGDFWRNIYRFQPDKVLVMGCWQVSGWIMTLYPYLTSGPAGVYSRNPHMGSLCRTEAGFDWTTKPTPADQACPMWDALPVLQTQEFPSGLSEVDFKCAGDAAAAGMGVTSGFVGYCVSQCTSTVHPVLGWLVTNKSDTCHLSGASCLHDCACSGHGKCEKGDEIIGAQLFGPSIGGGIGGGGGGIGGGEDKKFCRCFAGYRGVDCSQRCPSYSCGEHCGEFCPPGQVCDYKLGHCAPAAVANRDEESSTLPSPTMSHQTVSSPFQCEDLTSSLSSTDRKSSMSASSESPESSTSSVSSENLKSSSSSIVVSTTASQFQSSSLPVQTASSTASSTASATSADTQSQISVTETAVTETFKSTQPPSSSASRLAVSTSSISIQPSGTAKPSLSVSESTAGSFSSAADSTSVSNMATSAPLASPSPSVEGGSGVSGTSDGLCSDVAALQEAACQHDFVGLVKVRTLDTTKNEEKGRFSVTRQYKSPFASSRRKLYYFLPLRLYKKTTGRFDLEVGKTHILIANRNRASVKKVRISQASIFLQCPGKDISAIFRQINIRNC